jgi:tellurite resistance protein TehA-like permease
VLKNLSEILTGQQLFYDIKLFDKDSNTISFLNFLGTIDFSNKTSNINILNQYSRITSTLFYVFIVLIFILILLVLIFYKRIKENKVVDKSYREMMLKGDSTDLKQN